MRQSRADAMGTQRPREAEAVMGKREERQTRDALERCPSLDGIVNALDNGADRLTGTAVTGAFFVVVGSVCASTTMPTMTAFAKQRCALVCWACAITTAQSPLQGSRAGDRVQGSRDQQFPKSCGQPVRVLIL
jgi:hypothetical protein